MKIAIFHHHLNRGGVAQVITNHLLALDQASAEPIEVWLFFSGRKNGWPDGLQDRLRKVKLQYVEIEQLDYDAICKHGSAQNHLSQVLTTKCAELGLTADNCVLHFHNHNLGKNVQLIESVNRLHAAGYRSLLQIHDFAEDYRPENYRKLVEHFGAAELPGVLYPTAANVLFGVINRRDGTYLENSGIAPTRIEYIPNPVAAIAGLSDKQTARAKLKRQAGVDSDIPFLVYPVRGIRRKNVGESILLTLLAKEPIQVGLTLAPLNAVETIAYDGWKSLAEELRLPVFFDLGGVESISFADIMSGADQILTTSVAEGFGMAFLEGLAIGKPLVGRNLNEITADFVNCGISLLGLYDALKVPVQSVSLPDYRDCLMKILKPFYRDYELPLNDEEVDGLLEQAVERGWIDFGRLPTTLQMSFVRAVFGDAEVRHEFERLNQDCCERLSSTDIDRAAAQSNAACVAESFSLESIGRGLLEVYERLLTGAVKSLPTAEPPRELVSSFLGLEKTFPIRFETNDDLLPHHTSEEMSAAIIESSPPILPIPTELEPCLRKLEGIKVVLFDIYGTLLVSSSGDVGTDKEFDKSTSLTEEIESSSRRALLDILATLGMSLEDAQSLVRQAILDKHKTLRELGIPYPEIDIVALWKQIVSTKIALTAAAQNSVQQLGWPDSEVRKLSIYYELANNSVFPMPRMRQALTSISDKGLKLGIVSNAQFYTPIIVEAFCEKRIEGLGFDSQLLFFSYVFGRAKPDVFLYQQAANALEVMGVKPENVLYVGNDMTKDMVPAKKVGFRTGLFAGDQRSLRLGQYTLPVLPSWVDLVFTDLGQIDECLLP